MTAVSEPTRKKKRRPRTLRVVERVELGDCVVMDVVAPRFPGPHSEYRVVIQREELSWKDGTPRYVPVHTGDYSRDAIPVTHLLRNDGLQRVREVLQRYATQQAKDHVQRNPGTNGIPQIRNGCAAACRLPVPPSLRGILDQYEKTGVRRFLRRIAKHV